MFEHSHEIAYDLVDPPPPADVISLAETCSYAGTMRSTSSHIWEDDVAAVAWGTRGQIDFDIISLGSSEFISPIASPVVGAQNDGEEDTALLDSLTSIDSEDPAKDLDQAEAKSN